jgi:CRP/FNR family transcriptional regulator, dissimilatory nitrate respiration regulator
MSNSSIFSPLFPPERERMYISAMDTPHLIDALRGIPLFSALSDTDLNALRVCSMAAHYPRDTVLFRDGDAYHGFYVVLSGGVKIYKLTRGGRETVLHIMRPFNALAEIPMFVGGGYPAYAVTLEDSELLCVYRDGFLNLLRAEPELSFRMLAGLSRRLKTLGEQVEKLTAYDVKTRLARYLVDEYDRQREGRLADVVVLPTSKSLLAAHLGTIVETLSRALKRLETEGLIRVSGKKVFLLDVARLKASRET